MSRFFIFGVSVAVGVFLLCGCSNSTPPPTKKASLESEVQAIQNISAMPPTAKATAIAQLKARATAAP